MRIQMRSSILFILIFMLSICLLTGCMEIGPVRPPIALAIVIGKHANQNDFTNDAYSKVEPFVKQAVYDGDLSVIITDGDPKCVDVPGINEEEGRSNFYKSKLIDKYSDEVMKFLKNETRATHPEVDLLAAIVEAERALHDSSIDEKHIIIMDTGVSTAGRINLNQFDIDSQDISEFIDAMKEQPGILPNLADIKVYFVGLGDVAEPQELPDTTRPKLEAFWRELFVACGVLENDIQFSVLPSGSQPNYYTEEKGGFPFVSEVNFVSVTLEQCGKLELPDVGFIPDSSEYLNKEKVKGILASYAFQIIYYLNTNPDAKLYLVGTTATTTPGGDGSMELSQRRADKLKSTLVSDLEVPEDRLVSLGVGAKVPADLRMDEFRNGVFDSGLAQANRKVTVYTIDNEDFQRILGFNELDVDTIK